MDTRIFPPPGQNSLRAMFKWRCRLYTLHRQRYPGNILVRDLNLDEMAILGNDMGNRPYPGHLIDELAAIATRFGAPELFDAMWREYEKTRADLSRHVREGQVRRSSCTCCPPSYHPTMSSQFVIRPTLPVAVSSQPSYSSTITPPVSSPTISSQFVIRPTLPVAASSQPSSVSSQASYNSSITPSVYSFPSSRPINLTRPLSPFIPISDSSSEDEIANTSQPADSTEF